MQDIKQVDVKDVYQLIKDKKDIILLDVRTPMEYQREKIAGSINLPLDEVKKKVEALIKDKNKTIYVYCLSGSRSMVAANIMLNLGYENVHDIKSGILAWKVYKFPLVS